MKKLLLLVLSISCLLMLISISAIRATWEFDGTAVCDTTGDQAMLEMVSDGARGAFLVWEDDRNYTDIYAQRVDEFGNPLWTHQGELICGINYSQYGPQIIQDGAGGAIIAWYDGRPHPERDVYAQRVDGSGNVLWTAGGVAITMAAANQTLARLTTDGEKGAIIAWIDERSATGTPKDIYAQRVDSSGTVLWTADGVGVCTEGDLQDMVCIVSDGAGGAYIAWMDYRGTGTSVYVQRVDADGNMLWTADGIPVCTSTGTKYDLEMIADGQGGAIIAWCDNRTWYDLYMQRVDAGGNMLWTANGAGICISPEQQRYPRLIADGTGGAIVTWRDNRAGGNETDIYARKVSAAGDTLWTTNGVAVCTVAGGQMYPRIAPDNNGGAIVSWHDYRSGIADIYTQRIGTGGIPLWSPDGEPVCVAANTQDDVRIVSDGVHGAIIAWIDQRDYLTTDDDIYIDSFNDAGLPKVPALLQNYFIEYDGTGISINWTLSEANEEIQFCILRAKSPSRDFVELPCPEITGGNFTYQFTDQTCTPGKTYRYQVEIVEETGRKVLFQTSAMTVPAVTLSLEQNFPNPFNPRTIIRFNQPAKSYVNLSVYDLEGRQIVTLVDEIRRPGPHEVEWDGNDRNGNPVSSGTYFYRLKAGKQTLAKKMLLIK